MGGHVLNSTRATLLVNLLKPMSALDRDRWNERYAGREPRSVIQPDEWLVEALEAIEKNLGPTQSARRALDIACGLGHNAIWLAQQGLHSDAVDISTSGLELARQSAKANQVHVGWIEADLDEWMPAAHQYDISLVFRFLDRTSVPRVVRSALRPGGWLVYETFSDTQCWRPDNSIGNRSFMLAAGELLQLFPDFDVLVHRQDSLHDRSVVRLLARKRSNGANSDPVESETHKLHSGLA